MHCMVIANEQFVHTSSEIAGYGNTAKRLAGAKRRASMSKNIVCYEAIVSRYYLCKTSCKVSISITLIHHFFSSLKQLH